MSVVGALMLAGSRLKEVGSELYSFASYIIII